MEPFNVAELRAKTIPELMAIRAEQVAKLIAFKSLAKKADDATLPVVYMMRKSTDPELYVVRTAFSAMDIPGFASWEDGEDPDRIVAYAKLCDPFMPDDRLRALADDLERELARYAKPLPDESEIAYALTYEKVRDWMNVVVAWDQAANGETPSDKERALGRIQRLLERAKPAEDNDDDYRLLPEASADAGAASDAGPVSITMTVLRAPAGTSSAAAASSDSSDSEPDISSPINKAAKEAKKKKKDEMKVITAFCKERLLRQSASEPPLLKDDIVLMCGIWGNIASLRLGANVVEHMQSAYGATPVYVGPPEHRALAYAGFRLKTEDWVYTPPNDDPVHVFFREQCVFSYRVKTLTRTIFEAYLKWYDASDYPKNGRHLTRDLKRQVRTFLNNCPITRYRILRIKDETSCGWDGIALREDVEPSAATASSESSSRESTPTRTTSKNTSALKQAYIVERRAADGRLLGSWPSRAKASEYLKIGTRKLSSMVANKTPDEEGAFYTYVKPAAGAGTSAAAGAPDGGSA